MNCTKICSSLLLVFVILFSACKRPIKGEGPVTSQAISANDFTEITLSIPAKVNVVASDSFICIIKAQKNIIDAIKIKTDGDNLEITSDNNLKTDQEIEIFVSLPEIKLAEVNGSGTMTFVNPAKGNKLRLSVNGSGTIDAKAEMDEIKTQTNGSGTVTISGNAKEASCEINGSGDLHAFELSTNDCKVEINGSGDAEVSVLSKLKADIRGSGNIIYKGRPHVVSEIIGSGNIKNAE
ncbi:MAG: head GIN domain-containing protein [Bacteroidota bacterium]